MEKLTKNLFVDNTNTNLIKENRLDLGELYYKDGGRCIHSFKFWKKYDEAKNELLEVISKYNDYKIICVDNVEGTHFNYTAPSFLRFCHDYFNSTKNKIIIKTNSLNAIYPDFIDYYPCFGFVSSSKHYEIKERIFENKILFLNRVPREHRTYLYNKFLNKGLLNNFDYSINAESKYLLPFKSIENTTILMKNIMDILPNYFSCFVSLITETHFYNKDERDNVIFFTEKIDKVIGVGQPFIITSVPNYIGTLKKLGFKTFDRWWDESYDDEVDENRRLDKIINLVESLCKKDTIELQNMYKEMIPVLKHNQKVSLFLDSLKTCYYDYTFDNLVHQVNNNLEEYIYNMERTSII